MKPGNHLPVRLNDKSLLIFDFDGTVADTSLLHAAAFSEVLASFGIAVDYSVIAGLKTADAMRFCLLSNNVEIEDDRVASLVDEKQRLVRKMIAEGLRPLPGVDEFLRWARSRYRLAMVTSGSRGTVSLALQALHYEGWFDPLICADDVVMAKPDPEGFLLAVELAGVELANAVIFEDSTAGVQAARAAGIDCWDVRMEPMSMSLQSIEIRT